MKTSSVKTFFRDLIFLLMIFVPLIAILPEFYLPGFSPFTKDARSAEVHSVVFALLYSRDNFFLNWVFIIRVFYGNIYCVLFYHLIFRKILLRSSFKKILFLFFALTICYFTIDIFLTWLYLLSRNELDRINLFWQPFLDYFVGFVFLFAILYSTIRGLSWFRLQKIESDKHLIQASLSQLRSKINPEFVFNSLNSLYALSVLENAPKTSQSIEELSSLLHYSLSERTMDKVPIQNELDFIEKYIHLHRIRIYESDKIKVTTSIFWDKKAAEIIPMLLVNFIENAFKFGISATKPSFVEIFISVESKILNLIVRNSVHAASADNTNGFGLNNSQERLKLLYHDRYTLKQKRDETLHETILNINLG